MSNIILSMVLGLMMVYIAFRQWRTSHQALKLTLYDRRFKVYSVLHDYLLRRCYPGVFGEFPDLDDHVRLQQLEKIIADTASYKFLFKKDVIDFMDEVIPKAMDDPSKSPEINREWLKEQSEVLSDLFKPYLDFGKL